MELSPHVQPLSVRNPGGFRAYRQNALIGVVSKRHQILLRSVSL
jgi:hypothetical protein